MATNTQIVIQLLAKLISLQTDETTEQIIADATRMAEECSESEGYTPMPSVSPEMQSTAYSREVDEIYNIYPTKCPISGRNLGKTNKNKNKIAILIKQMGYDRLRYCIERYIAETKAEDSYFKNFGTLLNNIPDYDEPTPQAKQTEIEWQ